MSDQTQLRINTSNVGPQLALQDDVRTIQTEQEDVKSGMDSESLIVEANTADATSMKVVQPSIDRLTFKESPVMAADTLNQGTSSPKPERSEPQPHSFVKPGYSLDDKKDPEQPSRIKSEPQSPKTISDDAATILENMRLNRVDSNTSILEKPEKQANEMSKHGNTRSFCITRADGTSVSLISNNENKTTPQLNIAEQSGQIPAHATSLADTQLDVPAPKPILGHGDDRFRSFRFPNNSVTADPNAHPDTAVRSQNATLPPPVQPKSMLSESHTAGHIPRMVASHPMNYKKNQHTRPPPIYIPKPGQVSTMPPPLINTAHSFHPNLTHTGYSAVPCALNYYPHQTPFAQYYTMTPPSSAGSTNVTLASQPGTPNYPYPFSPQEGVIPFANGNGVAVNPSIPGTTILLPNGAWPQMYPGYMTRPYSMMGKKHTPGPYSPRIDLKTNDKKYNAGGHQSHMFMRSRKRSRQDCEDDIKCQQCGTRSTPEWRRGPNGFRTLCNACGLYHAKMARKKGEDEASRLLQKRPQAANH